MSEESSSNSLNLVEIAKRAGVSRSTVSRVVNGEAHVSPKTRDRVLAVIAEVGYTPNAAARMLRTQRTQIIGVVLSDPVHDVFASDNPYYYSTIIRAISAVSQERGYAMLLWAENREAQDENFYARILNHGLMDGLISLATRASEENLVRHLLHNNTPTVLMGRPKGELADRVSFVSLDNSDAAEQVVQHLYQLGRRRIGHLTGDIGDPDSQERLQGYRHALQALDLYDESLVAYSRFHRQHGYESMQVLLQRQSVDAIFAGSDMIAVGAMDAIKEAGLRVPEDIAVVGFDDFPVARETRPPLTTVRQPLIEKAELTTSLLLDLIEGKRSGPQQVLLPTKLVIRDSCGARS